MGTNEDNRSKLRGIKPIWSNKLFLSGLFLFTVVFILSVGIVNAEYYNPLSGYYSSGPSKGTATTATATAPVQTTPVFDVKKPEDWYKYPDKAAELLKTDSAVFAKGLTQLSTLDKSTATQPSPKVNTLWKSLLAKGDATQILKLKTGSDFNSLWDKIDWDSAAKTFAKLNEEQRQVLLKIMSDTQIKQMSQISFTEKRISEVTPLDLATKTSLGAIRKDLLSSAYKFYSSKDGSNKEKPETKKFFNDLWAKMNDKGKPDVNAIKKLVDTLNEKGMEDIRGEFVVAVESKEWKDAKNKYPGLEELKINNPNYKIGSDKDGKLTLVYNSGEKGSKDIEVLKFGNAQGRVNKIDVGTDGTLSLINDNGIIQKYSLDFVKSLTTPMSFDIKEGTADYGKITFGLNGKEYSFDPYYGAKNERGTFNIDFKGDKVTISGTTGWIRDGDKFYTFNRELLGSFSVTLENKNGKQISRGKNVDVSIALDWDSTGKYNSYNANGEAKSSSEFKAISFRTTNPNQEIAFFGINEDVPAGTLAYVKARSENIVQTTTSTPTTPTTPCQGNSCPVDSTSSLNPTKNPTKDLLQNIPTPVLVNTVSGVKLEISGVNGLSVLGDHTKSTTFKVDVSTPTKVDVSTSSNIEIARFANANQISNAAALESSGGAKRVSYIGGSAGLIVSPTISGVDPNSRIASVLRSTGIKIAGGTATATGVKGIGTTVGKTELGGDFNSQGQQGSGSSTTPSSTNGELDVLNSGSQTGGSQNLPGPPKIDPTGGSAGTSSGGSWDKGWSTNTYSSQIQSKYASSPPKEGENVVVIHSTNSCPHCTYAKNYADENNVKYITVSGGSPSGSYTYIEVFNNKGGLAKPGWTGWEGSF